MKTIYFFFLGTLLLGCEPEDENMMLLSDTVPKNISVNNIAALKRLEVPIDSIAVDVLGYYEPNDGGGGIFYWDNAYTEPDNAGTIISINGIEKGKWRRVVEEKINVKWFGAKGDGKNDDLESLQAAISYAGLDHKEILIPEGNYLIKGQLIINDAPIIGIGKKSKLIIGPEFVFSQTSSGKSTSCIFNSGYQGNFNFRSNQLYIKNLKIECSAIVNKSIYVLGLANIKSAELDNLYIDINNVSPNSITGIDIRACGKNIKFNKVQVINHNQATSGGGIWIRNITNDGADEVNNTEDITLTNCVIKHAAGDEAFAIYGVQGRTKNIKITNCQFEALPSLQKHSVLVSVFALNNKSSKGINAAVENIEFNNCTFKDFYFTNHVFRVGRSEEDSQNICDRIMVKNSYFKIKKNEPDISFVARNIKSIGDDNNFIGNKIISNQTNEITHAIAGFNLAEDNLIIGKFNYGISYCNTAINNNINNLSGIGLYNNKINSLNKVKTLSHCILIDSEAHDFFIENNNLENMDSIRNNYTGIFIKSIFSRNPNVLIKGNSIKMNNSKNYALRRDGTGEVRVLNNTITGKGKPLLSSNFLSEIKGNNWFGISDDIRSYPYFNYDYNRAIPLGQIVLNSSTSSPIKKWVKITNNNDALDWIDATNN